jgi:hypothetical protein
MTGKFACTPGKSTAFGTAIEMRNAEEHKILKAQTRRRGGEPYPILIIDEFYMASEKNKAFVRTLISNANAKGVTVFLMTNDTAWASELSKLNGGTKCKPLPQNVDNAGYTGTGRFVGNASWNVLDWTVEKLRDLVRDFCEMYNLNPIDAIPDDAKYSPGGAMKAVAELELKKQLDQL